MVSLVPEPSEGSPSGSTPPGGSAEDRTDAPAPSDQEIQKIQQQVNRQLAIDDFKGAVTLCEELCGMISSKFDELHDACAEPYYQYATALLEVAREENQILAAGKLQEEAPDSTDAPAEEADGEEAPAEEADEEEGDEGEDEEDVSSLQIAWEVLELSRIIYSRNTDNQAKRKLAKVKIKLGEVSMENEKMDEAITHFQEAVEDFLSAGEQPDSRDISSTHYLMGLAASLDQKYGDAVTHFSQCSQLMASQAQQVQESDKGPLQEMKSEVDRMITDCKDSLRQMDQYRKLIPSQSGSASCDSSSAGPSSASGTSSTGLSSAPGPSSSSSRPSSSASGPSSSASGPSSSASGPSSSAGPTSSSAPQKSSGFGVSSSSSPGTVTNISHLVRKRPVSQPVQPTPIQPASPSSSSEITSKLSVKPTVRVSPMVTSSTSPSPSQTQRRNGHTSPAVSSSNSISSSFVQSSVQSSTTVQSNVQSSTAVQSSVHRTTPAHAVSPSINSQANGVSSSTSALEARFGGGSGGFSSSAFGASPRASTTTGRMVSPSTTTGRTASPSTTSSRTASPSTTTGPSSTASPSTTAGRMASPSTTSSSSPSTTSSSGVAPPRQVAAVSSVQRTEEAISSTSDFKRPAQDVEDMSSNEAKRSRQ